MKLQLQTGSLRLRVSEAELAQLLQGQTLALDLDPDGAPLFSLDVRLQDVACDARPTCQLAADAGHWCLTLPAREIAGYAGTLPRRDALVLEPRLPGRDGTTLRVLFEVDVRDSVRARRTGAGEPPRV